MLQAVPGEVSLHPAHACIGMDGILSKSLAAALHAPTLLFDQPHSRDLSSVSCPLLLLFMFPRFAVTETITSVLSDKLTQFGALYVPCQYQQW